MSAAIVNENNKAPSVAIDYATGPDICIKTVFRKDSVTRFIKTDKGWELLNHQKGCPIDNFDVAK